MKTEPGIAFFWSGCAKVDSSTGKQLEKNLEKEIFGKKVLTNVTINYDADSLRPKRFEIEYTIDGEYFSAIINN